MTRDSARTIKDRLKAIGMSQAWLAEKVGVSIAAVSRWATDGKVSRDNVPRVTAALGLTADQLLGVGAPACAEATWSESMNADEKKMLELYRLCSQEGRVILKELLARGVRRRRLVRCKQAPVTGSTELNQLGLSNATGR